MQVGRRLRRATPCVATYWNRAERDALDASSEKVQRTFHRQGVQHVIGAAGLNPMFWNLDHTYRVMQFNRSSLRLRLCL